MDFFIPVWFRFSFLKNSDSVQNEFGSVLFIKKTQFGSDIIVT